MKEKPLSFEIMKELVATPRNFYQSRRSFPVIESTDAFDPIQK